MHRLTALVAALAISAMSAAQTAAHDTISIDAEFVPRFAQIHPDSLVIPPGETLTLTDDADFHSIEVAGTLRFDRHKDITLRCVNLQVLASGTLDMGTVADPLTGNVEVVIKDVPLDTEHDPFQWGNGILCLGKWLACGQSVEPWSHGPLPDSVAAVDKFKASIAYDNQRNVTIRSENGSGTRGHTVVTHNGYCDVRYVALINLGRTMPSDLDNTVEHGDGRFTIGTNQVARYVFHWHHNRPKPFDGMTNHGVLQGCFIDSGGINKWGIVIHGTHFTQVTENVVTRLVGAGIITEDGNETHNLISRNLLIDIAGNGMNDKANQDPPRNNPGAAGSGIWLHGNLNTVTNNLSVDCAVGLQAFYRNFMPLVLAHKSPSVVGGDYRTRLDYRQALPLDISGNISVDCETGYEQWNGPVDYALSDFTALRGMTGVKMGGGQPGNITLNHIRLLGCAANGVSSSHAYTTSVRIVDSLIVGSRLGVIDARSFAIENSILENEIDVLIQIRPPAYRIENSMLNGKQKLVFSKNPDVSPKNHYAWLHSAPCVFVKNWQGTGQDYILVEPEQDDDNPAEVATASLLYAAPESGLTLGECWEKYGLSMLGLTADYDQLEPLAGVIGARGKPGLEYDPGVSRFVLCYPNAESDPLPTDLKEIKFYVQFTGEPYRKGDGNVVVVDGIVHPNPGYRSLQPGPNYIVKRSIIPQAFTKGSHVVKTWMTRGRAKLPGSELTFYYDVGEKSLVTQKPKPLDARAITRAR